MTGLLHIARSTIPFAQVIARDRPLVLQSRNENNPARAA